MTEQQQPAGPNAPELAPAPASVPMRRVVTGTNEDGKSCITSDGPVPANAAWAEPGVGHGTDPWVVRAVPVDLREAKDALAGYALLEWPSPGGLTARVITWQPGFSFPLHKSDTLDLCFVISGRIELVLDDGCVILNAGDTVVQRGTNHGWRVVGDEPCTLAAVLIDASGFAGR